MFCAWRDRRPRPVLFLSTSSGGGMVRTVSRRGRLATKPRVAALYNEGMGGVDLGDQKTYTYSDDRRQVKLWKKMMFRLLHTAMMNAHILYKTVKSDQDTVLNR